MQVVENLPLFWLPGYEQVGLFKVSGETQKRDNPVCDLSERADPVLLFSYSFIIIFE